MLVRLVYLKMATGKDAMKTLLCAVSILLLPIGGFCQSDGVNPPIDPRTNMEGYPTSRLAYQLPSLKYLSRRQVQFWQARKSGSVKSAKAIITDSASVTSYTGAEDGKQLINQIKTGVCKVNSFKLENFMFNSANSTTGVLTYRAIQDATCDGKPLPQIVQVKVGYSNPDGKWLVTFYVEEIPNPSTRRDHLPH